MELQRSIVGGRNFKVSGSGMCSEREGEGVEHIMMWALKAVVVSSGHVKTPSFGKSLRKTR
jgi:hypothetical protein